MAARMAVESHRLHDAAPSDAAAPSSVEAAAPPPIPRARREPLCTVYDLLLFLYLYPLRFFAAFASRDLLYALGRLGEPFLQFRSREWKKRVMRRMLAVHGSGITPERAPRVASQLVANAVFRLLDDLVLSRPSFARALRCQGVEGREHLERAKSAGKGVLVISGHFYASRLAKRYLATIGYPMLTVRHQEPVDDFAGRLGRRVLQPRLVEFLHGVIQDEVYVQDPGCTLKILQRLRSGGLVNIHVDARHGAKTAEWPLLGVPRRFASGVFDVARLSGCAVVPMLCLGRSTGFRVIFNPPLDILNAPTREEFLAANLPSFAQTLEKQIAGHPEEWTLWTRL
jgi:Kdo2-lipid IVA lauroyltransferase/acyltransferase